MLCTYDRATRIKTAILHNASEILDPDVLNKVGEMSFYMPKDDSKLRHLQPFHYVQWDGGETIYRILDEDFEVDSTGRMQYKAEHAIATLIDDCVFGTLQIDNWTTRQVIEKVLSLQATRNWILGDCEFTRLFSYSWSNENLLAALFSIPNRFDVPYKWEYDFSTYPWRVHLRILKENIDPEFYIRDGRNLLTSTGSKKGRNICTRLYALGYGEGVNQLTFSSINGGKPYIENAEAIKKYGLISRIWEDLRFEQSQALLDRAKILLDGMSKPYETYSAQVAEIEKLTGRMLDTPKAGKIMQWDDLKTYIRRVNRYRDVVGMDTLELANAPEDIAGSISDLADRQRINSVYAQGATCLYAQGFNDNAEPNYPATIRFFVPSEARQINKVILSWYFERFRAYSVGAESTTTTTRSTSAGGKSTRTSSSGGGTRTSSAGGGTRTSSAGGGDTVTSEASSKSTSGVSDSWDSFLGVTYGPTDENGYETKYEDHVHWFYAEVSSGHSHSISHTHTVQTKSHTHDVDTDHSHTVSTDHSHTVSTDHTHTVEIPEHTHNVDIPGHTHKTIYGIHEDTVASSALLHVDGKLVSIPSGQREIDIAAYLSTETGSGKIRRGAWHTVQLFPNQRTRIVANLSVQLFIQSEGGGLY